MASPNLQMFRSDIPTEEIGIDINPINFGLCLAGETTYLPYDIILYNDKGNILSSEDAYNIYVELLRLYVTQNWVSTGLGGQTYTITYIPVVNSDDLLEVTVDGTKWTRVGSLVGYGQSEVYTFNFTTGALVFGDNINGKIPPTGLTIEITCTPDIEACGKSIYSNQWISLKSSGIVYSDITITTEESTKIDNDTVQVLHYPKLQSVVGVWDNIGKTGTNYYTSGSFDTTTGLIILGTPLTDPIPYVEYTYRILDDNTSYTALGSLVQVGPLYRIPKNNAKKLQLKVTLPSTVDPNGGIYLKTILRFTYKA